MKKILRLSAVTLGLMILSSHQVVQAKNLEPFLTPPLTGADAIVVPPSGEIKRDIGLKTLDSNVSYAMSETIPGITLEDNILTVDHTVQSSDSFKILATSDSESQELDVEVVKKPLSDFPANPLNKENYKLYYTTEFSDSLEESSWSDSYLKSWSTDERSKAQYYFQDDALKLIANRDIFPAWSSQDGTQRVSGVSTFERQYLHRFGTASESRNLPVFDGLSTKYGYFEIRLKMPNTRDGSHFAWWMVGVQDDQNMTPSLASNPNNLFPSDGAGWGVEDYYWTNQGAEYDIIEQHLDPNKAGEVMYDSWLPVIHKNGTRDYDGRWYAGSDVPASERVRYSQKNIDPYNEYHVYGFDWSPEGTKFYLDNELVYTSTNSAAYRMMTILSLYAGKSVPESGDYGWDRGIYPKEAMVDYFRVYKKDEPSLPNEIRFDDGQVPDQLFVPNSGETQTSVAVNIVDQFDQPYALTGNQAIKWAFSSDIGGQEGRVTQLDGITIDENTGVITTSSTAKMDQDVFLTAYLTGDNVEENRKVLAVKHVKLGEMLSEPRRVVFNNTETTIAAGETLQLNPDLIDQYGQSMVTDFTFDIDNSLGQVSSNGLLTVSEDAKSGDIIAITADSGKLSILDGQFLSAIDPIEQKIFLEVE